ncbi:unnamed protein product, partial [marine sediment metagenome]
PAVAGPNVRMERKAMENLDWLVAIDIFESETAAFWKGPEANAANINTEVFLLPAACTVEGEGSVTNSGRWSQWRYQAVPPPGDAQRDLWIIDRIFKAVRGLYAYEGGVYPGAILDMDWDYGDTPDVHKVAKEINGYDVNTGKLLPSFGALKDDGSTSSGNWLYNKEYVAEYTNAAFLIDPEFNFEDGLFSGYDSQNRKYDKSTWRYQVDEEGIPKEDKTLQDPRCVFQLLKKHFSRYDVDTACQVTGTPKDVFLKVAETYCATGKPGKAGTIMYAMGTTQHTNAAQMIRSYAVLQLLLGNIGVAGGGVNALRGWSNVQGATDHCILFHILPGYLKTPRAEDK